MSIKSIDMTTSLIVAMALILASSSTVAFANSESLGSFNIAEDNEDASNSYTANRRRRGGF